MKQYVQFNEQLKQEIHAFEEACENLGKRVEEKYQEPFHLYHEKLLIELIREKKGKRSSKEKVFDQDYDSFLEVAIEVEDEYYPNATIPIWKCKGEWFQKVGYFTKHTLEDLEQKLETILSEMIEERREGSE
ncbi:hypothetical protein LS684_12320 [Cytobacillus spongiae]|jgi:hypothetical protein|uniref:hypothetical protein n=1 Tax=Cytobacillus spongiae TaxID=2901381 RepID=UPI001F47A365|nr:hypothetical protein [Cytobacillus spongiae]UII54460.1 hypothetical protein LS684_12320 [Cytobacillus spongiae]